MDNEEVEQSGVKTIDINYNDIPDIINVKKLNANSWEDIQDLVASAQGKLIGPFQVGKPHKDS